MEDLLAAIVVGVVRGELERQWVVDVIVSFNPEWLQYVKERQD